MLICEPTTRLRTACGCLSRIRGWTRKTDAAAFQIESGPVLIPADAVDIAGASVAAGCYLAYVFFNKTSEVDLLAWGAAGKSRRDFSRFARIDGLEIALLGRHAAK